MLSFSVRPSAPGAASDELDVIFDREGLEGLLSQLQFLRDGRTDHVHLMAESWGGSHLSELPVGTGSTPIRHVKISMR
jgi:hypothetical protein